MPDDRLRFAIGACGPAPLAAAIAQPPGFVAHRVSRSATTGWHGLIAAASGRIGLDMETRARVALDATADDPWLSERERMAVRRAADPVIELACCWVLREAYGKALGVGLALPLDRLSFGTRRGVVRLEGGVAAGAWAFALYRHADVVIATAWDAAPYPTPFAPFGRNPPTAPPDR